MWSDNFSARSYAATNSCSAHLQADEGLSKFMLSLMPLQTEVDSLAELLSGNLLPAVEASQELQIWRAFFHMAKTTSSTENDSRNSPALYCKGSNYKLDTLIIGLLKPVNISYSLQIQTPFPSMAMISNLLQHYQNSKHNKLRRTTKWSSNRKMSLLVLFPQL